MLNVWSSYDNFLLNISIKFLFKSRISSCYVLIVFKLVFNEKRVGFGV